MSATLKLGTDGKWASKEGSLLAFNDKNDNYKPLPFTFDRSTSATRVNKEGLIEVVSNNEPRIDFLNDSKGALLLEPARTNYLLQSNQFDTTWTNTNTTVTSGQVGVGGSSDAWKVDISSAFAQAEQTVSNNGVQTFSVYAKAGTLNWIRLRVDHTSFSGTYFDLQNGQVGSTVGTDSTSIENLGNGWYRCTIVVDDNVTRARIYPASANNDLSATSGNIYIQYAQLEAGSYATSYIPTQGSTVTRVAESCNDAGNDQVINSTEGVLYFEGSALANDGTNRFISLTNGATDATNISLAFTSFTNQIRALVDIDYSLQVSLTHTVSSVLDFNKVAFLYKQNDFKLYINGVLVGTDTSGNVPSANYFNNLSFIRISALTFYGNVKDVKIYNTALTDQELINLTTI